MKKLTTYILILIALIGVFAIAPKVYAQIGTCTYTYTTTNKSGQSTTNTYTAQEPQTNCLNGTSHAKGTWDPKPTPVNPLGTPVGTATTTSTTTAPGATFGPVDPAYHLLAPLTCPPGTAGCNSNGTFTRFDPSSDASGDNTALGLYLNLMIKIVIGLAAVMAVVMIVFGGIEYMTRELISSKEAGKDKIKGALLGLLLVLGAYALLYTINPDLLKSNLTIGDATVEVTLEDQIKFRSGEGTCTPVADSSNPCSATSLASAGFTNATQASSICNAESKGNPTLGSGVDKGSDGSSFSFGLFQINVLAHASEIKDQGGNLVCSGVFTVDPNPPGKVSTSSNDNTLGGCLQRDASGKICVKYAAKVTNQAKYQSCKAYITNPNNNIKYAANLQTSRNWYQWGANASCRF